MPVLAAASINSATSPSGNFIETAFERRQEARLQQIRLPHFDAERGETLGYLHFAGELAETRWQPQHQRFSGRDMRLDRDGRSVLELDIEMASRRDNAGGSGQRDERQQTQDEADEGPMDRRRGNTTLEGMIRIMAFWQLAGKTFAALIFFLAGSFTAHAAAPVLLTLESADLDKPRVSASIKAEGGLTTSPTHAIRNGRNGRSSPARR